MNDKPHPDPGFDYCSICGKYMENTWGCWGIDLEAWGMPVCDECDDALALAYHRPDEPDNTTTL